MATMRVNGIEHDDDFPAIRYQGSMYSPYDCEYDVVAPRLSSLPDITVGDEIEYYSCGASFGFFVRKI